MAAYYAENSPSENNMAVQGVSYRSFCLHGLGSYGSRVFGIGNSCGMLHNDICMQVKRLTNKYANRCKTEMCTTEFN